MVAFTLVGIVDRTKATLNKNDWAIIFQRALIRFECHSTTFFQFVEFKAEIYHPI